LTSEPPWPRRIERLTPSFLTSNLPYVPYSLTEILLAFISDSILAEASSPCLIAISRVVKTDQAYIGSKDRMRTSLECVPYPPFSISLHFYPHVYSPTSDPIPLPLICPPLPKSLLSHPWAPAVARSAICVFFEAPLPITV